MCCHAPHTSVWSALALANQKRNQKRHIFQTVWTVLTNGYVIGYFKGRIYSGNGKAICVPGLNCYSCPGAVGACPIGSLQAELASRQVRLPFYVIGFLLIMGSVFGRFICGFLCPFGLVQDLLYKIPSPKIGRFRADRYLRYAKYVVFAVFVILLPLVISNAAGNGSPWFCKLICPAGTLGAGIPLLAMNESLALSVGLLFYWKVLLLVVIVAASIFLYRPFCKYLCPLGAAYALFNRVSLYQLRLDESACTHCGACKKVCRMQVDPSLTPHSAECIRCGDCVKNCPHGALRCGFSRGTHAGGHASKTDRPDS